LGPKNADGHKTHRENDHSKMLGIATHRDRIININMLKIEPVTK